MLIKEKLQDLYLRFGHEHPWTYIMYERGTIAFMRRWERATAIWTHLYGGGDGTWEATSSQNNRIKYLVSAAHGCNCPDAAPVGQAPYGWCKHRIAAWIADRVLLEGLDNGWANRYPSQKESAPVLS